MKIFVISLREATSRRKHIEKALDKFDFPFEIIDAVNGKAMSEEEIDKCCDLKEIEKYPIL